MPKPVKPQTPISTNVSNDVETKKESVQSTVENNPVNIVVETPPSVNSEPNSTATSRDAQTINPFDNLHTMSNAEIADALYALESKHRCRMYAVIDSPKFVAKIGKALKAYAHIGANERPILMKDATVFGSAKEGFVLTNRCIYSKVMMEPAFSLPIDSISEIFCSEAPNKLGYIFILSQGKKYELTYESNLCEAQIATNFLKELIKNMKSATQPSPITWVCACGNINSGNFCSKCGKAKNK